ncbi:MAG TPA: Xaa-Pro peptidase family protein [Virgibacillus sp.]|nr:Xaa-Pro peptidase family protein [Virgibacillus sp.]
MTKRIHALLKVLESNHLDSILITSKENVYYMSNYYTDPHERLIGVFISRHHDPFLIVPAMEINDARASGWSYDIMGHHDHEDVWKLLADFLKKNDLMPQSLGIEEDQLAVSRYQALKEILPQTVLTHAQEILSGLRVIKDDREFELLKQAAELADFGIQTGIHALKEGRSELEIIAQIEFALKKQGVQQMSFSTMVLSGIKTASPHGSPSKKLIAPHELVLFDLGVVFNGYCSDITRTVAFDSVSEEQERIYHTVLAAEQKAIEACQIGSEIGEVDQVARQYIQQAGYGDFFPHRIGHGLGINVHEYPSIHGQNKLPIQAGMCFTVEPGVYVPETGGVRIEDMIFMTEEGPKQLTESPKELLVIT